MTEPRPLEQPSETFGRIAQLNALFSRPHDTEAILAGASALCREALVADYAIAGSQGGGSYVIACVGVEQACAEDAFAALARQFTTHMGWSEKIFVCAPESAWAIKGPLNGESAASEVALALEGSDGPMGLLIIGFRPPRVLEPDQRAFIHLLGRTLAAALDRRDLDGDRRLHMRQIVRAKREWEAAVDTLSHGVALLDGNGQLVRGNRRIARLAKLETHDLPGISVERLIGMVCGPCELTDGAWTNVWQQFQLQESLEWEEQCRSGGRVLKLALHRVSEARKVDGFDAHAVLSIQDVTNERAAENSLRRYNRELEERVWERTAQLMAANGRLRAKVAAHRRDKLNLAASERKAGILLEHTLAGICTVSEGVINYCNARFASLFQCDRSEIEGMRFIDLVDPTDHARIDWTRLPTLNGGPMPIPQLLRGRPKGGGLLWLQASIAVVECEEETMILANLIDITREKMGEELLRANQQELRQLSARLIGAQESERKRIACELHDGIGQYLSAIRFSVHNALLRRHEQNQCIDCEPLHLAMEKIQEAAEEVRRIATDLRPSLLDDLGLLPTIDWFCREYQGIYGTIRIIKRIEVKESDVREALRVVIYRIMQEAMNNIAKYAGATEVTVRLERREGAVFFSVQDNGKGFSPENRRTGSDERSSMGLESMRERAELSGGTFRIVSSPGAGTVVEAFWPDHRAP